MFQSKSQARWNVIVMVVVSLLLVGGLHAELSDQSQLRVRLLSDTVPTVVVDSSATTPAPSNNDDTSAPVPISVGRRGGLGAIFSMPPALKWPLLSLCVAIGFVRCCCSGSNANEEDQDKDAKQQEEGGDYQQQKDQQEQEPSIPAAQA